MRRADLIAQSVPHLCWLWPHSRQQNITHTADTSRSYAGDLILDQYRPKEALENELCTACDPPVLHTAQAPIGTTSLIRIPVVF
jgi:hypothetical protein